MTKRNAKQTQVSLPSSEAEARRRAHAKAMQMTPAEAFELSVQVGIYKRDGTLTPEYGGPPSARRR